MDFADRIKESFMKRLEYLLACLSEESGEVIQEVGKASRFGIDDVNPKSKETNADAIHREMIDVIATYLMVFKDKGGTVIDIENLPSQTSTLVKAKQDKVEKWMVYSKEKGCLDLVV